tara:strand:- start:1478 stop:1759 length:282 start_codon:yes stop_codon:yes gene_type:complete
MCLAVPAQLSLEARADLGDHCCLRGFLDDIAVRSSFRKFARDPSDCSSPYFDLQFIAHIGFVLNEYLYEHYMAFYYQKSCLERAFCPLQTSFI